MAVMDIGDLPGWMNMICGVIFILVGIPLAAGRVKRNRSFGFRFRACMEDERTWYDVNRYGGRLLILFSIPLVVLGVISLFLPLRENGGLYLFFTFTPLIIIIPVLMAWYRTIGLSASK